VSAGGTAMLYVIDTHVLIWYFTGNRRLSEDVRNTIDQVRQQGGRLLVPTIVLAEALNIAAKGRVVFDFDLLYQLVLNEPEFEIAEFGVEVFEETLRVSKIPEIHDRIIVATSLFYGANLLTKDGVIRSSGEVNIP
jgi:PIN domain nuclease of toxin-antitoxin system